MHLSCHGEASGLDGLNSLSACAAWSEAVPTECMGLTKAHVPWLQEFVSGGEFFTHLKAVSK